MIRTRPVRRRTGPTALALAVAVATTAACTSGTDARDATPSSASASASGTDPAAGLLADYGLTLPEDAVDVTVTEVPAEPYTDRYGVTLTSASATAQALCDEVGLAGAVFEEPPVDDAFADLLGVTEAPTGSSGCYGSVPEDLARQVSVLVEAGAPATVRIGVYTMPSR